MGHFITNVDLCVISLGLNDFGNQAGQKTRTTEKYASKKETNMALPYQEIMDHSPTEIPHNICSII